MKKLLSLVLAAMLCLCALPPAMAETTAAVETFPYTLSDYKVYFDLLASDLFGVAPQWATDAESGIAVASVPGYGDVKLGMDANQNMTEILTVVEININDDGAMYAKSLAFGKIVALAALSSKAAEDAESFAEKAVAIGAELETMINELVGGIDEDWNGDMLTIKKEVDGNLCTVYMMIDMTTMTLSFGFQMLP